MLSHKIKITRFSVNVTKVCRFALRNKTLSLSLFSFQSTHVGHSTLLYSMEHTQKEFGCGEDIIYHV